MMSGRKMMVVLLSIAGSLTWGAAFADDTDAGVQPVSTQTAPAITPGQWFEKYDEIRRQAQMTPGERREADALMSKGMSSILGASSDSNNAKQLLTRLVSRYDRARQEMRQLPIIPQTEKLHRGYYQYFSTAHDLFSGYLAIQDNLFAKDESGQPLIPQLLERKARLEALNTFIQELDAKTRSEYKIPPYRYSNG